MAGNGEDVINGLGEDWKPLWTTARGVTGSGSYIRQNGLLLLNIWGIRFADVNVTNLFWLGELVDWLRLEGAGRYRGEPCHVRST